MNSLLLSMGLVASVLGVSLATDCYVCMYSKVSANNPFALLTGAYTGGGASNVNCKSNTDEITATTCVGTQKCIKVLMTSGSDEFLFRGCFPTCSESSTDVGGVKSVVKCCDGNKCNSAKSVEYMRLLSILPLIVLASLIRQ